ncbi:hypothetical protein Q3G72_027543 [Acer saccharum]|nr:hypothetical protein Q3G72_027543 [Acer saccharum]
MKETKADMREMREMNREIRKMNREMQELKADMREMRELKADMREMNREMQELKADIRVMKECMQRLSRSASADRNIDASSLDHEIKKSAEGELQLLFSNKLPDKIYTNEKIKDDSDGSVEIKLINTMTRKTIEEGPLSYMEIKIHVLDGDFGSDGHENWTEQEFDAKIVQQRKSKGPLVKGKQNITLRKGVGIIDDLSFFDNSSWNACGKFRLGARVLQRSNMGQARIKEAISQDFAVRDYRVKNDQKLNAVQMVHQVFAGMQNANNHASSSHDHKGGFSTAEEIVPNLASQPLDTSTGYPANAQGVQGNSNGVSGRNSSQSNYNPLMTESSQINNGPHSHFPAEHVFNAFNDTRPNAYSNPLISQEEAEAYDNRTTGPLYHAFRVPHQGIQVVQYKKKFKDSSQLNELDLLTPMNFHHMTVSSQNNNGLHSQISGVQQVPYALEDGANPLISQEVAAAYNSPTTGPLHHEYAVPHQGIQVVPYKRKFKYSSQLNELDLLTPVNTHQMTVPSQNNNGPHSHISGVKHALDDGKLSAPLIIPEAEAYNSPATGPLHPQHTVPNQGFWN